jgi:hypothetical protein
MIQSILTQLWNRRKANFSVFLELLFVFCLVWYITDYLFVYAYNLSLPNHCDLTHTWQVNTGILRPGHPDYREGENEPQALFDNYHRIIRLLEAYPGVEAVSVSLNQAVPGTGSYRGREYYSLSDTSRMVNGQLLEVYTATDYFGVFRHTRKDGAEAVRMSDFDWSGTVRPAVVSRSVADALFPEGNTVGQQMVQDLSQTDNPMTVVGVVDDTKRFDYLRPRHAVYLPIQGMDAWDMNYWGNAPAISVRSSASVPDDRFAEAFGDDMAKDLHIGNYFFKSIVSHEKIAENTAARFGISSDLKVRVYLMLFFLLNILLCVLGTFWYRVNIRRSEIGLRKAMGASASGIRGELFLEGLCLLAAAALAAMTVELQFVVTGVIGTFGKDWGADVDTVYLVDRTAWRFLITNGITAIVLAAIILTAIALPARRAAALHPAEALRDE